MKKDNKYELAVFEDNDNANLVEYSKQMQESIEKALDKNKGEKGDKGDTGDVLPVGGTKGQVLTKNSEIDGDATWKDSAGGDALPIGSIVDYDGDTVPEGYEEVEDTVDQTLENKVDKVAGKELSSNDFTDEYKNKLDKIQAGATNLAKIILNDTSVQNSISVDTSNYNKGIFIFSFKADGTSAHSCHIMSFRRHSSTASSSIQLSYNTINSSDVDTSVTYSSSDNEFTFKKGNWGGILTVFYIGV